MMKSNKEMSESVLNSVNEYKIRRNMRNEILRKAVPLCCLCVLLAAGGVFLGIGGYESLSPTKTEGESKPTSAQNSEPAVYATEAETSLNISVPAQLEDACWIPNRYANGYMYFRYTYIAEDSNASEAKENGKNQVFFYMNSEEIQQWENYLDIESLLLSSDIFSESVPTFSTLSERYQALLEREPKKGEPVFDLYRDKVDCYYDNKLSGDISIKEGMIIKAHIEGGAPPSSEPDPGWQDYKWVCTMYNEGAVFYEYLPFDSAEEYNEQNEVGKAKVLAAMSEEERKQWKNRLDIEDVFPYFDIYSFKTIDRLYKVLLERDFEDGYVDFELYERGEKIKYVTNRFFSYGMNLKVYLSGFPQGDQPVGQPDPNDIPDIIKGKKIDGINGNTTVGDIKNRLNALGCEDITVYEIELIDPDSKPIDYRHSRVMSDEEDLSNAYGIYIEFDYLGETYALEFFSEEIGSLRVFHKGEFALKSEFPLKS